MADVVVAGMHGLGDCLHQRAVVRALRRSGHQVHLRTPWPQLYGDLVAEGGLRLLPTGSRLRTQARNEAASASAYSGHAYSGQAAPPGAKQLRVWYTAAGVQKHGSILAAMLEGLGLPARMSDFRLPVPPAWVDAARGALARRGWAGQPVLVYRPLVERTEWAGCAHRNPEADAYRAIVAPLAAGRFRVSVADLVPGTEWITGRTELPGAAEFHAGELQVEVLAGLYALASAVYCSPGFSIVLAQAVGTPVVCVHGGREDSSVYAVGGQYAPTLGIDTVKPCRCFDQAHACERRIDVPAAVRRVAEFVAERVDARREAA